MEYRRHVYGKAEFREQPSQRAKGCTQRSGSAGDDQGREQWQAGRDTGNSASDQARPRPLGAIPSARAIPDAAFSEFPARWI